MNKPTPAGATIVEQPAEKELPKNNCDHAFEAKETILKKKTLFTAMYESTSEIIAGAIFCKKCGHLSASYRIKA